MPWAPPTSLAGPATLFACHSVILRVMIRVRTLKTDGRVHVTLLLWTVLPWASPITCLICKTGTRDGDATKLIGWL